MIQSMGAGQTFASCSSQSGQPPNMVNNTKLAMKSLTLLLFLILVIMMLGRIYASPVSLDTKLPWICEINSLPIFSALSLASAILSGVHPSILNLSDIIVDVAIITPKTSLAAAGKTLRLYIKFSFLRHLPHLCVAARCHWGTLICQMWCVQKQMETLRGRNKERTTTKTYNRKKMLSVSVVNKFLQ